MVVSSSVATRRENAWGVPHLISVVIPVYQGASTLPSLLAEIAPLTEVTNSPDGHPLRVDEVLLVFDNGPDDSAAVIRQLAKKHSFVRPIWLSKNFGQHAATIAGIASSTAEWIVTVDEDGQHNPRDIGALLDAAMRDQRSIVYARSINPAPHGWLRNVTSRVAKWLLAALVAERGALKYNSFRLILGSVARGIASTTGDGLYLDVAIGWVAGPASTAPVELREEGDRKSGYTIRSLVSHFGRMILTSGTRGLRFVSGLGVFFAVVGLILGVAVLVARLSGWIDTQGWASLFVLILFSAGAILFALGIIAEYIGASSSIAMGKPHYLITSDPALGPLGRQRPPKK